jgi:hypothetical protein
LPLFGVLLQVTHGLCGALSTIARPKSLELPLMFDCAIALAKWASLKSLAENRAVFIV